MKAWLAAPLALLLAQQADSLPQQVPLRLAVAAAQSDPTLAPSTHPHAQLELNARPGTNGRKTHAEDGQVHSGLSAWSVETKEDFIKDLRNDEAAEWTIVMGNEGGDLDSMVSALTWAYHLTHLDPPQKAIALLQTEEDALDLRPENSQALFAAGMSAQHRDLLTIDELPIKPWDLSHRVKGFALVDHNVPRKLWVNASVNAIIDHHDDRNHSRSANPRVIGTTASCSSLVVSTILNTSHTGDEARSSALAVKGGYAADPLAHFPRELVELVLRTIAIDSKGLKKNAATALDQSVARALLKHSIWRDRRPREAMKLLFNDLAASKSALDSLSVRDLLRRDWKGDQLLTKSKHYPFINLGFASMPVSLNDQILRTPEGTPPEWFAIERAWTDEIGADISVALTTFIDPVSLNKKHEIAIVVAHGLGQRLGTGAANRLFKRLVNAVEDEHKQEGGLLPSLKKWKRPDGKHLLERRAVWSHEESGVGRKLIRPLLERATMTWEG